MASKDRDKFMPYAIRVLQNFTDFEMHVYYNKATMGDDFSDLDVGEIADFMADTLNESQAMTYSGTHFGSGFIMGTYYYFLIENEEEHEL